MLSDKVLEEFVRNTALREHLVSAAWPNLSTESRLQVLFAMNDTNMESIPTWLCRLALADSSPIVRYFASRLTYFRTPDDVEHARSAQFYFGRRPTEDDIALWRKAREDIAPLVRATAERIDVLSYKILSRSSQFERLVLIRGLTLPNIGAFMEWLGEAIAEGVSDDELGECTREFLALPCVQRELSRENVDFHDGEAAYLAGKGIEAGWNVVKKAGPRVQNLLAFSLPTSMGLYTISVEELAQMPARVLSSLAYRSDVSKEIAGLIEMMGKHPERFSADALKSIEGLGEDRTILSADERAKERIKAAVDRSEAILEMLLTLQERLDEMREQLAEIQEVASRKRGFFG